jgi:DNA-binding NarL/FixJ family response regulator
MDTRNPEKSNIAVPPSGQRLAVPHVRPRAVFAHDDVARAGNGPAEAARILIVEDDYLVASEMEAALAQAGFEIAGPAASAEEALQLAAGQHPALVVMDIRLDGPRDGIDTALELFATRGIRCVFVTAHHNPDARARARPANPLAWLPKPYTMPSLVEVVRRALADLHGEKT